MANAGLSGMVTKIRDGGYFHSKKVESALLSIDRQFFVPAKQWAYDDRPFPIGFGQTISAPSVVAFMLEKLDVRDGQKILELGSGSGYNTALLSCLVGKTGKVITTESVPQLVPLAKNNIEKMKEALENASGNPDYLKNMEIVEIDGSCGYEKEAPYDRIIVTAAMPAMPALDGSHPLISQLKDGGKLLAPVGDRYSQNLLLYDRKSGKSESILPVIFVPLIGKCGFGKDD